MNHKKTVAIVLLVAMLASIPIIHANATPGTSTSGTGTIVSITLDTNPTTKITTTLVSLLDNTGVAQIMRTSLDTAVKLGLVIPAINPAKIGQNVEISNTDPQNPSFILSGVVNNLALVVDPVTGVTSLTVTLTDTLNVIHTVSLKLSDALPLELITAAVNPAKIGTPIVVDPQDVLDSTSYSKAVSKLGSFFGAALGVTFDQIAAYQKAGYGYGVISQACWMAVNLKGDAALLDQILTAKKTGDFSAISLPDGKTVVNWGQLRKLVLTDPHQNLGRIMSGKATPLPTLTPTPALMASPVSRGNGNGNGNGNGHGNNK